MKHLSARTALGIAAVLALSGCGGGSGGDAGQPPEPPAPVNHAPVISGTPPSGIHVGQAYQFIPTATDADGDNLVFSIQNQPAWAQFYPTTGELSGIPGSDTIGEFADVVISVTDGHVDARLPGFAISVLPKLLTRDDFVPQGQTIMTADGYRSTGSLVMNTGDYEQKFDNSDLVLKFDEEGNLLDLAGDTDLPPQISKNVQVIGGVKSIVGMMKGSEINADEDFGIQLMPDTNYFVYYIGTSFEINVSARDGAGESHTLTIEPPLNGQVILIADPTDAFLYRYANTPLGEYGNGESDNGLIPFVPDLDYNGLDAFNGHTIEKGSMGLGIKIFDFFEIGGTRVVKQPQFADINWDDIFDSAVEYKAGINGYADFAFSVLNFGLLSFELAQMSGVIDVGFDQQQMAMSLRVAPEKPILPAAFGIQPLDEINGSAYVRASLVAGADPEYGFLLDGLWHSQLPEADIMGQLSVENGVAGLAGSVTEGDVTLGAALEFSRGVTVGRITFPASFAQEITSIVSGGLDREVAAAEQAARDLEDAIGDYDLAVSLQGLRDGLPAIADQAISTLDGIPATARSTARTKTLNYLATTCQTVGIAPFTVTTCLDDLVDENAVANDAGDSAYQKAASAIVAPRNAMVELRTRAQEADDAALRQALYDALDAAYDNRTVNVKVTVTHTFGSPFSKTLTIYSADTDYTVLNATNAGKVLQARDNVHLIGETSDIVVSTQQIVDQIPTDEVFDKVRNDVDSGVAQIPSVDGLGYRAVGNSYEPFVTVDGVDHDVPFNVLKPSEVRQGVGDLLAQLLLGSAD